MGEVELIKEFLKTPGLAGSADQRGGRGLEFDPTDSSTQLGCGPLGRADVKCSQLQAWLDRIFF